MESRGCILFLELLADEPVGFIACGVVVLGHGVEVVAKRIMQQPLLS